MSLSPREIECLADAVAERVISRLAVGPSDDALVDVHAAAALLGCSVPTVERQTSSGAIPSVKIGRLRRYRRSVLLNLETEAASLSKRVEHFEQVEHSEPSLKNEGGNDE